MQPKYQPAIKREDVVLFTMCRYNQPREIATKGVRKMPWGYRVLDPIAEISGLVALGDGPTVVHGDSGVYVPLSSNPHDMFGPFGYTSLTSVDDVDAMIKDRRIMREQTIKSVIQDCQDLHTERGMPHVHN